MSKSSFVKSTIVLTIATLISKVLGSVFRIPLQNIAGDEVLGIFNLVYPVYMVALILSVAGLPLAISKLIAEERTKEDPSSIRDIYVTASILAILFGFLSFTLIVIFSSEIANLLGGLSTRPALIVVASTLLIAPYMAVYRGYFQGFKEMNQTAISQVIEQFIRAGFIITLAYILVGKDYAASSIAGGAMLGSVFGVIASLIYLVVRYRRFPLRVSTQTNFTLSHFKMWSKRILSVSIPIAIGTLTMALFHTVDSFTVSNYLKLDGMTSEEINYWYGVYSRGLTLVQIATVFATSVVLPLVPLISSKLAEGDVGGTRSIIERTHEITHIISWPVAIGLLSLALPINLALFTNLEGSSLLAIIGLSSVFTSLTVIGTGVLQGMNLMKSAALIILGGIILKIFLNILFMQLFGLEGAAFSTLLVYLVIVLVNTIFIWKGLRFTVISKQSLKIILISIILGLVIGIPTWLIDFSEWNRLHSLLYVILASGLGAAIYVITLWKLRVIDKATIRHLSIKN